MPLVRSVVKKLFDKFFGLFIMNKLRELDILLHDFLINFIGPFRGVSKRQGAAQKLIQADSQRPQIHQICVPFTKDNIWRHVMRSSNDGKRPGNLVRNVGFGDLGRRQVNEFEVALIVDQEVLWLDVPANDLNVLEVFEDQDDACGVELCVRG